MSELFLGSARPRAAASSASPVRLSTAIAGGLGGLLVVAQYALVYAAALTPHSRMPGCLPSVHEYAYLGWYSGACRTEEQVWCERHGNLHADCATADCRAEEIRITLSLPIKGADKPPSRALVYSKNGGCANTAPLWELLDRVHPSAAAGYSRGPGGTCGACVPADDKRAPYLYQPCNATTAACRAPYYAARYPHSAEATAAAAEAAAANCAAHHLEAASCTTSMSSSGTAYTSCLTC